MSLQESQPLEQGFGAESQEPYAQRLARLREIDLAFPDEAIVIVDVKALEQDHRFGSALSGTGHAYNLQEGFGLGGH